MIVTLDWSSTDTADPVCWERAAGSKRCSILGNEKRYEVAEKMKVNVADVSPVRKKITVEIEAAEVDRKVTQAYRSLGNRAKIPGFRKGKIPRKILEQYFGNQVFEEVQRDLVNETLPKAVEETEAFPITIPAVENGTLRQGQNYSYSAILEVKPTFELKDYLGLEVEEEILAVTDEDVDRELIQIRKNNGKLISVEDGRGIQKEDYAVIHYQGFEDGVPIEGIKSENFPLQIGSNQLHEDFDKGLMGLKKGDRSKITVLFPEDHHHPRLSGRKVEFEVEVKDIKVLELPALDDAFAKGLGADFEDLEGLKSMIKEELTSREKKRIENELKGRLLKAISAGVEFELPQSLVDGEIRNAIESVNQNLMRTGSDLKKAGLSEEKLKDEFRPGCEKRVKEMLILDRIAEQEKMSVTDLELNQGFEEMAANLGQDAQVLRQYYEANRLLESFRQRLLEEKTLKFLVEGAKVKKIEKKALTGDQGQ